MTENEARDFLASRGYQVDNLWHVNDVLGTFDVTEEEAMDLIVEVMNGEGLIERVFESISDLGDYKGHKRKEDV